MKMNLKARQKVVILIVCCIVAFIGFMLKLPSAFRSIDKELHAVFYFCAAAFLNILFRVKNVFKHALLFVALYLSGIFVEYIQAYSNKLFHIRIHGRFDPADVRANLNGLIVFSTIWLVVRVVFFIFQKTNRTD